MKDAGVTAVCLFSRGHHGWCYYPTKVGEKHPNLKRENLLGEQIEALKSVGIVPSIYTTVCWDELQVSKHPEWVCLRENGQIMKMNPLTGESLSPFDPGWTFLCWNSPYRDYVLSQSVEVCFMYPDVDYLFVDILFNDEPCCCPYCLERMKKHGLDSNNPKDREKNSLDSAREFMEFLNNGVHSVVPDMPLFYNSRLRVTGSIEKGTKPELQYLGVIIVESLPSGPWGYEHFPLFARYFQNFPQKMMGHTGKFQKMWGDFGGLKNQVALDYEVIRMMALGVVASIGDQLPPSGQLDSATYDLIGHTYNRVSRVEEHLIGSKPIDEVAIMLSNKEIRVFNSELDAEKGAMKMLSQLHYQFSFVDEESDLSSYTVLILPDIITVDGDLAEKLKKYMERGGKILASYQSGLNSARQWAIDGLDLDIKGEYPYKPYYVYPGVKLQSEGIIEKTDHIQYLGGMEICLDNDTVANKGIEVLATITNPYFNRTWDHFCSHLQTPPNERTDIPEMVFNGENIVYFSSMKFSCYNKFSSKCDRNMVEYGLDLLMSKKIIVSDLPSTAEVTLRQSPVENGQVVLTVIHYVPQRRTDTIDIIEDVIPLYDIHFSVKVNRGITSVVDADTKTSIDFVQKDDRVEFVLSKIEGYRVILFM